MGKTTSNLLPLPYNHDDIDPKSITLSKVRDLYKVISEHPYAQVIRTVKLGKGEALIFTVDVERGQHVKNDIRYKEHVCALFNADDSGMPKVLTLREDFPHMLHQNQEHYDKPKSLCLYDIPYHELKLSWTALVFLERIRSWLSSASLGTLHQDDQQLEPFILGIGGHFILPPDFEEKKTLYVELVSTAQGRYNVVAYHDKKKITRPNTLTFTTLVIVSSPIEHGVVNRLPQTLFQLSEILSSLNIDLSKTIKSKVDSLMRSANPGELENKLLILCKFPIISAKGKNPSLFDYHVFISNDSIKDIAKKLCLIGSVENSKQVFSLIPSCYDWTQSNEITISQLKPFTSFTRELARVQNGISSGPKDISSVMIGLGAIGSNLLMNFARKGFSSWALVDNDILLPHNLARHNLKSGICEAKSILVSTRSNHLLNDPNYSKSLVENFMLNHSDELSEALSNAELIVDCSASIAVERKLAFNTNVKCKCISVFLNPSGTDLVILSTDKGNLITLDLLEMQYYRELINNEDLSEHMNDSELGNRYGTSCRDISSIISNDHVTLHSSIASSYIQSANNSTKADINIWSIDNINLSVGNTKVPCFDKESVEVGNLKIIFDSHLKEKIYSLRQTELPNETGGVLIGSLDQQRNIIYVIDTILAPSDSDSSAVSFNRGIDGLESELNRIKKITGNNLYYVGEWHSHPNGASLNMSEDDIRHLNWLSDHSKMIGYSLLSLIVGLDEFKFYSTELK